MEIIKDEFYMPHQSMIFTKKEHLNDFNIKKINSAYTLRKSVLGGDEAIWEIEFHPTNYCNIKCDGCSYGSRHDSSKLSFEFVKDVLDRYKDYDIRSIFFSGGGDPLLWKHWDEFFNLNHSKYKYKIGIATNMFNFEKIKQFTNSFDFYQIHVTGYDKESSFNSTGVDSFVEIDKNLRYLFENKTNEQEIALKILIIPKYHLNLNEFLSYLQDFDADSIVLKYVQNFLKNENLLTEEIKNNLRDIVYNHKICNKYDYLIDNLNDVMYENHKMPDKCYFANSGLYRLFNAKGEEYPCIVSNTNKNYIKDKNIFKDTYSFDMINKKCPLRACRHFRFSQSIEKMLETKKDDVFSYEPMLL